VSSDLKFALSRCGLFRGRFAPAVPLRTGSSGSRGSAQWSNGHGPWSRHTGSARPPAQAFQIRSWI